MRLFTRKKRKKLVIYSREIYVVIGCCRGVDWMIVERGFKREAFVGIESDSLSVDGDRAEQNNDDNEWKSENKNKKPVRLSCVWGRRLINFDSVFVFRGTQSLSTAWEKNSIFIIYFWWILKLLKEIHFEYLHLLLYSIPSV